MTKYVSGSYHLELMSWVIAGILKGVIKTQLLPKIRSLPTVPLALMIWLTLFWLLTRLKHPVVYRPGGKNEEKLCVCLIISSMTRIWENTGLKDTESFPDSTMASWWTKVNMIQPVELLHDHDTLSFGTGLVAETPWYVVLSLSCYWLHNLYNVNPHQIQAASLQSRFIWNMDAYHGMSAYDWNNQV